jgi:hypothetical protein
MHDIDPLTAAIAERLRRLPGETREPYSWEEFRQRATSRSPRAATIALRTAAAVLLVAAAAATVVWMDRGTGRGTSTPVNAPVEANGPAPAVAAGASEATYAAAAAEHWLARQPAEPAIVRVGSYAAVAGLEDRIAQLDDLMSAARAEGMQPASLSALQDQRARLVSSLAQVRYAETLVSESPR